MKNMRVKKVNNTSEQITFSEIMQGLKGADYLIFPKLQIKDVIDTEVCKLLTRRERNLFNTSHFDFLITKMDHSPLFAVEFDGPHHQQYKEQVLPRDIMKNRICQIAELPLIRVSDPELERYDSISILQYMVRRFVSWVKELPRIKNDIQSEIDQMSVEEFRNLVQDGFLDPEIDPHFRFDLEFGFPLTKIIKKNLVEKYKLNLFSPPISCKDSLWCYVMETRGSSENGNYNVKTSFGICKGTSIDGRYSWVGGKLEAPGVGILLEGETEFQLRWALITDLSYDFEEAPFEYFNRMGYFPIYDCSIPGADPYSVCKAVSEYLAYKKIIEWAESNLN